MIGAIVLVALAVIFLPMLIKGPAPESGVADVPLDAPEAPQGEFETRELPLVTPGEAPAGGAVGMESGSGEQRLPTVDAGDAAEPADDGATMPAATAGGDYAVNFGTYSSLDDAGRVVAALKDARLPGYQESVTAAGGRTLHRVRVGPFATRADAEAARVRATGVHGGVVARVVALDADAADPAPPTRPAVEPAPPEPSTGTATAQSPPREAGSTEAPPREPSNPPAPATTAPEPRPAAPAAATVGFAVQLGAFSQADEANKLRDRARAAGFTAFIEQVRTDQGVLSRVRVGPVASRSEAEQLKAQVAARLGVAGIVRPHP